MVFIDLGKAYDKVPRKVLKWALMRKEVPKMYLNMAHDMYEDSSIRVNIRCIVTEDYSIGVGVHQGFSLSPYLLFVVMDKVAKEIQGELPWSMVFAVC